MKKVLLTSTALVAFAGAASAEVSLSGSAEMGIVGGEGVDTQFIQSIDVRFSMTGETDGGLTFGATIDLDDALDMSNAATDTIDETGFSDFTVFISGNFGTVTMGDTDGAMDWALTEAGNVGNPGSINDAETAHLGYVGSYLDGDYDGQILRYDNTFGDFGVAVSVEQPLMGGESDFDTGYALGLKYNAALGGFDIALGLGYQSIDGDSLTAPNLGASGVEDALGFSATTTFDNGLSAGLTYVVYGGISGFEDVTHTAVGFGYQIDAVSLHMNYGVLDSDDWGDEISGFGIAAAYDLGGGASVNFGYSDSDDGSDTDYDTYSLGLVMSF